MPYAIIALMNTIIAQKLKTLNILYAEDEDGIRTNMANSLRYYAKEVIEAKDGLEAYELYKKHKIDILYTDILMPNLNGIDLVRKIREEDKKIAIVMISAHTDKEYLLKAVELHLEQYLVKPIDLKTLKSSLEKCVNKISQEYSIKKDLPDGFSYDFDNKVLTCKEEFVKLTKKEVAFFELLLKNKHRVVSYSEIENEVWKDDFMSDLALKSLVRNLRGKFCKKYLKNYSGIGYRLEF